MGYDKTMDYLVASGMLCCIFSIGCAIMGLSSYGIYVSENMPDMKHHECKQYNCTVEVIGKHCRAKFLEFPNNTFISVTCDIPRNGFYQIILPCNGDSYGNPVINCDTVNSAKTEIFISSVIGLLWSVITCFAVFAFISVAFHNADKGINSNGLFFTKNNHSTNPQSETAHYELDETDCKVNDQSNHPDSDNVNLSNVNA